MDKVVRPKAQFPLIRKKKRFIVLEQATSKSLAVIQRAKFFTPYKSHLLAA